MYTFIISTVLKIEQILIVFIAFEIYTLMYVNAFKFNVNELYFDKKKSKK